jgi:hypothetical protein
MPSPAPLPTRTDGGQMGTGSRRIEPATFIVLGWYSYISRDSEEAATCAPAANATPRPTE